jgi:mannose-6-phosphate isomerase-like protein (cupin superfamily)
VQYLKKTNILQIEQTKEGVLFNPAGFYTFRSRFTEKFNAVFLYYPPGIKNNPHSHEDLETIYFIVEGEGWVTVGEEQELLKKGDLVFIPKNTKHQVANRGKGSLALLEVTLQY